MSRFRAALLAGCLAVSLIDIGAPRAAGSCGDPATYIHDLQGRGDASDEVGRVHEIEGVVVGDFQAGPNGFFVQEEDRDADADARSSEGIFVHRPPPVELAAGDRVRVRGRVAEYRGLTELAQIDRVILCGSGFSVTPAVITLPVEHVDDFEAVEGMAVILPQTLYIGELSGFGRFGEIGLSSTRHYQPTQLVQPGSSRWARLVEAHARDRIVLDNPRRFGLDGRFRAGDTLSNVTGVMDYAFGRYRLHPTREFRHAARNPRPVRLHGVDGNLRVASVNARNFFTTRDRGRKICGPAANLGCRGAASDAEFTRQRNGLIQSLLALDADIVGLAEIENHPADAALSNLVEGLNTEAGDGMYATIETGVVGSDAIKVALLYRPGTVAPVGEFAVLDDAVDPAYLDAFNRPALAQTFEQTASGERFTVAVNHLKSKGSACDAAGDPDTGDGQGNCNLTRRSALAAEAAWLASDPTGSGDADVLIIGDLNAYAREDPIEALRAHGYTDLIDRHLGPRAYSFLYGGQLGYLDHALASASLLEQVTGVTIWHINADEPEIFDYRARPDPGLDTPGPYRRSDHDPVLIGLELRDAPDP